MTTGALNRRLAQLEANTPQLRQRVVFQRHPDEPLPEPEPGERLVVIRWIWDSDNEPPAAPIEPSANERIESW